MENKNSYKIKEKGIHGDVKIADDVIAIIAALQRQKSAAWQECTEYYQ